jgi:hypothetical protein
MMQILWEASDDAALRRSSGGQPASRWLTLWPAGFSQSSPRRQPISAAEKKVVIDLPLL